MTTTTLESLQNEVIRDVLNVRKTHEYAASQPASAVASEEAEPYMTKEEILTNFDQACKELKLNLEGKLEFKPAEELLNEL